MHRDHGQGSFAEVLVRGGVNARLERIEGLLVTPANVADVDKGHDLVMATSRPSTPIRPMSDHAYGTA